MHRSTLLGIALLLLVASVGCHRRDMTTSDAASTIRHDEVRFASGNLRLAATITRPIEGRGHPGVVVLHAAGLDRRSDYRTLSDSLALRGIVVLAYDMRGAGDSEGAPGLPSFQQLSQDARAALQLLREQKDVDAGKVGLWALSRGGYTAPIVAVADRDVRFLIVVSSTGLPVGRSDSLAMVERATENRLSPGDLARYERFLGLLFGAARNGGAGYERLQEEFNDLNVQPWFSALHESLPAEEMWSDYGRNHSFDPDSMWRRVRIPTLLIYGGDDRPRLITESRTRILSALAAAGAHVDAPVYADADHFITVGAPGGEKRFAPGFFDLHPRWIAANVR